MVEKLNDNSYESSETIFFHRPLCGLRCSRYDGFTLRLAMSGFVTEMTVMESSIATVMKRYRQVYLKLYQREPRELRDLGTGWVLVNGARMQVSELVRLTDQMQNEYRQAVTHKRNVVMRLLTWLREN